MADYGKTINSDNLDELQDMINRLREKNTPEPKIQKIPDKEEPTEEPKEEPKIQKPPEPQKIKNEKPGFITELKKPYMFKRLIAVALFILLAAYMLPTIQLNVLTLVAGLVGRDFSSLFFVSFVLLMFCVVYIILVNFYTRGITNTLVYAKMFNKKINVYLDSTLTLRLLIPEIHETTWRIPGKGEWAVNPEAMVTLQNGQRAMISMYGHAVGINLRDIKNKYLLWVKPDVFEDRNRNVRIEEKEKEHKLVDPKTIIIIAPIVIAIGVALYIANMVLQSNQCQAQLLDATKMLAQLGQGATNTAVQNMTTATSAPPKLPGMADAAMQMIPKQ